ncbi:MAG: hypothetical protein A2901_05735 [Elusimicrobia bacterium RIFCSPLOWO2_01_FULL_54_10]|nr:MAG: hypothetical protein A2901_05735 [Elusimicrobia bacterium RIFCSPLOWO2_01_FULL_54_10]
METQPVILLAMHGMPASDFPKDQLAEWGRLHSSRAFTDKRYLELDGRLRNWPRTPENDPYHAASYRLARLMESQTGKKVVVGFNEFDRPSMEDAFADAARLGASRVVVITPMMTRGGSHSESDIPQAIEKARKSHPGLSIDYVWPLDESRIAEFLSGELRPALHP